VTKLRLAPYADGDEPAPRSVPVTVVVLTKNEEANIGRCLASVAWAAQVIVVDSGSADATVDLARAAGAEVIRQDWLGFAGQRDFAVRHPAVRHDWVYFVDADEWISAPLAGEIAARLAAPSCAAYTHRLRLVFQGRWIRHCGWYAGSWVVRLVDRRHVSYGGRLVGERAQVDGPVGRLRHDIVDEDRKGLASWLHKHVDYASLEAAQRGRPRPLRERLAAVRSRTDTRPWVRAVMKDIALPSVPARPLAIFAYMYLVRAGFLDGLTGLRFCFYHAWYESCVTALAGRPAPASPAPPRLSVLDFHPIQYHAPLYRALAERGHVTLDVLFVRDHGYRATLDPGFGVPVAWDIDLLSGYRHAFLPPAGPLARLRALARWIRQADVVVVHGHSDPWMLAAVLAGRVWRTPYLLRGDAGPAGNSAGLRRAVRTLVARLVVAGSAGGLAIGARNAQFYRRFGAPAVIFAPHSVDNARFSRDGAEGRAALLARLGLRADVPVVMFCGKLQPHKRPLDVPAAAARLARPVALLFVGDGPLADEVRRAMPPGTGAVTGFVNQSELAPYYRAADILVLPSAAEPWGLVVNEAMAAGAIPVVSDRVGAAADLVAGVGEIYPCGDVAGLTAALGRALDKIGDPDTAKRVRERVDGYGIERTAAGFERAARHVLGS
jgi:glycosyltransferase involved in cell wall biosynthesis